MDKIPFKDTWFYKVYCSPFIRVLFSVIGDTMGIWGAFIILNYLFVRLWPNLTWPGINYFIQEGKIILVSFAFLSAALYYSTRRLRINFLNSLVILHLIGSVLVYSRAIALKVNSETSLKTNHELTDSILYNFSIYIFLASIILYYWILAREKFKENRDEVQKQRKAQQNNLEIIFKKNKR